MYIGPDGKPTIPPAALAACRRINLLRDTRYNAQDEFDGITGALARVDLADVFDAEIELRYVATHLNPLSAEWDKAPSKSAAIWLYHLRKSKVLREVLLKDLWTGWMKKRLDGGIPSAPKGGVLKGRTLGKGSGVVSGSDRDAAQIAAMGRVSHGV